MITTLLLAAVPVSAPLDVSPSGPQAEAPASLIAVQDLKEEYEKRRAEADGDKAKLWKLVDWCEANAMPKEQRSCLRAIVKLDDNDKKAHEMLGHIYYDGQWFTNQKKADAYRKKQEEKIAKEQGLVRYGDGWAHPDDIPFLERGMVKTPDGSWVDPEELKRIEEGWRQQDLTWIPPAEFEQLDKGLWKCGDEWLSLEDANAYHAELDRWWTIPGDYFHLYTTLPRNVAEEAMTNIQQTYRDLVRIYGLRPSTPPHVLLLNSFEQYNAFAAGTESRPGTDVFGFSSCHGSFFADAWFGEGRKYMGAGVGYWDHRTSDGASFGRLFARHAAGQSFGEAVDPSPKTIGKMTSSDRQISAEDFEAFYGEKKVPFWFRYGAASYVERYYVDSFVGQGGDPHWARKWAVDNILRRGGLDSFDKIFEMALDPGDPESEKLISQAGLLVAFTVDGECKPVIEKHGAVKAALKSGKGVEKAFEALEKAIVQNEDALRMFANL